MKLYYTPGACSLAPHIVAREAGFTFDLVKVDLTNKKTEDGGDYWTVNPKGYVPALGLDNGDVLTEANVICQYLADQKPDSGLAPKPATTERYRLLEALTFVATEVHKQLGAMFNPAMTQEMKEVQLGVVKRRFDALDRMLGGREFVCGDKFSIADAYLFAILTWTKHFNIDVSGWPNIKAFIDRIGQRPKVQEALKAEGLAG